jgi:5-methylcytosine-specific restriction endonuclease McrA
MEHMFPSISGHCACGCGAELTGRKRRWASKECSNNAYLKYSIVKGNISEIRKQLYIVDDGFCRKCGVFDEFWQADHIVPVHKGGGGCDINGFQTLCVDCHKEKTRSER